MEKVKKYNEKLITREQRELEKEKIKIETIAKQLLKDIGIKLHHLGFKYWVTAMYITLDIEFNNRESLRMMELYYMVARKHRTTATKVERAMRYAYATIDLKQYFKVSYTINNTALLFLLKEAVKEQYIENNLYIVPREYYQPKVLLCNKKVNTPK